MFVHQQPRHPDPLVEGAPAVGPGDGTADPALDLLLRSIDLPEGVRTRFLDQECAGNPALREAVAGLLACGRAFDEEGLDAAIQAAAIAAACDSSAWIGRRLGAYRITSQIGEGGMGAVFLAERADERFEKKVAIKLVTRGLDAPGMRERLIAERRILAHLDHPYIAKLLDGGESEPVNPPVHDPASGCPLRVASPTWIASPTWVASDEGVPYLVMEYVAGNPLEEYARSGAITLDALVRTVEKVCEAVAFAHRNLIVHRDLKPSNILVDAEGTPKLLDFGIAGAMGSDGVRAYTPAYAAPEVIEGKPVTTAADIYSLGAVLRKITPPTIPADLDAVIRKALSPVAGDRYASADELARDLERWRKGYPVTAQATSWHYRTKRYVARNRWYVSAGAAAALAIAASSGEAWWQAKRATAALEVARAEQSQADKARAVAQREQLRAERQAQLAEQARSAEQREHMASTARLNRLVQLAGSTLTNIHDTLERMPASVEDRRKIVNDTISLLEQEQKNSADNPDLLEIVAEGYRRMGLVTGGMGRSNLGDPQTALRYLTRSSDIAHRLLLRERPDSTTLWTLYLYSTNAAGAILAMQGQPKAALARLNPALEAARRWRLRRSFEEAAGMMHALAIVEMSSFKWQDTLGTAPVSQLESAVGILQQLAKRFPENANIPVDLASAQSYYLSHLIRKGDKRPAIEVGRKLIATREDLAARSPQDPLILRHLMLAHGKQGDLLGSRIFAEGDVDPSEAYRHYDRAIEIADRIVQLVPADVNARLDAAMAVLRAGMIDPPKGQIETSLRFLHLAEERFLKEQATAAPGRRQFRIELSNTYEYIGKREHARGDRNAARAALQKSLAYSRAAVKAEPANLEAMRQVLFTEVSTIRLIGPAMPVQEREEVIAQAEADVTLWTATNAAIGAFRPRIREAVGDLHREINAAHRAGCAEYLQSLRLWKSFAENTSFPADVRRVSEKANACNDSTK